LNWKIKMKKEFISLKGLNLTYNLGATNAFQALHDVDVEIEEGDFAIVLGPSGCGKSSLLNIIAGLELPEKGSVLVRGQDLLKLKEKNRVDYHRKEIGMIFQAYNLISTLNVLDNVALPQIFINKKKKERDQRSMKILERLGISEHAKKIPSELSGGQQQRIGIARAIINEPQIILADEPVGNLDSVSSNNVMEILNKLNVKEGKTVVMVTHNAEHAVWGNRIIHMRDGKITQVEIKNREGLVEKEEKSKGGMSEFNKFVGRLKGLSKQQIKILLEPLKAKCLVDQLTKLFSEKQRDKIELVIKKRLNNQIDLKGFYEKLDKSEKKGGVGLDKRSAENFSEKIEFILKTANIFSKANSSEAKAKSVVDGFVDFYGYKISKESQTRATSFLGDFLAKKKNYLELKDILNKSIARKGAGFDQRIIEEFFAFLELVQIVGYGLGENKK